MSDFHNVNLPSYIEIFAVATIEFSTICASTKSGREVRNAISLRPKRTYQLKDCRLSRTQFEIFNSFFYARCGKRYAFRLKDHFDYKVKKQLIGKGDGSIKEFQLVKIYQDSKAPYIREITKPLGKSVSIFTDEDKIVPEEINLKTGKIKLSNALSENAELFANFEFDVPVRFDKDSFQYSFNQDGTISLDDVRLVEVL